MHSPPGLSQGTLARHSKSATCAFAQGSPSLSFAVCTSLRHWSLYCASFISSLGSHITRRFAKASQTSEGEIPSEVASPPPVGTSVSAVDVDIPPDDPVDPSPVADVDGSTVDAPSVEALSLFPGPQPDRSNPTMTASAVRASTRQDRGQHPTPHL